MKVSLFIKKCVRKGFLAVNMGYVRLTCKIAGLIGISSMPVKYFETMVRNFEAVTDYYAGFRIRPKTADNVFCIEDDNVNDSKIGLVMQGPLYLKDHFELETVRIYGKLFPSARVIISTWTGEDEKEIELLKKESNCTVIQTDPEGIEAGILHSNLQIVSTMAGLKKAKEIGCTYVAKLRGDERIYEKGALRYMVHLLETFPCNCSLYEQKKRLITFDIATPETSIMFYPFWITDMFMFGDIDDMLFYWNSDMVGRSDMQKKKVDDTIRDNNYSWKRRIEEGLINECRIAVNYVTRKTGCRPEITVRNYWDILRDYFIVVNKNNIDLFFEKHFRWRINESWDWGTCFTNDSQEELLTYNFNFVSWFNLYNGDLEYREEYENIPEERFYRRNNYSI